MSNISRAGHTPDFPPFNPLSDDQAVQQTEGENSADVDHTEVQEEVVKQEVEKKKGSSIFDLSATKPTTPKTTVKTEKAAHSTTFSSGTSIQQEIKEALDALDHDQNELNKNSKLLNEYQKQVDSGNKNSPINVLLQLNQLLNSLNPSDPSYEKLSKQYEGLSKGLTAYDPKIIDELNRKLEIQNKLNEAKNNVAILSNKINETSSKLFQFAEKIMSSDPEGSRELKNIFEYYGIGKLEKGVEDYTEIYNKLKAQLDSQIAYRNNLIKEKSLLKQLGPLRASYDSKIAECDKTITDLSKQMKEAQDNIDAFKNKIPVSQSKVFEFLRSYEPSQQSPPI